MEEVQAAQSLGLQGFYVLFRWIHVLSGITWIGMLYYFNFIQTPFFGSELGGGAKSAMTRGLVPNALWWFRWGAMFTFLSGLTILLAKWHLDSSIYGGYMTLILTGALMGTLMWANVWFVIWPAQQVVIANAERVAGGGEADPAAPARAKRAGVASRTNTLFSIPMLLFMVAAANFTGLTQSIDTMVGGNLMAYWICALVIILAVELNCLVGADTATQKPLGSVSGTIHSGLGLTVVLFIAAYVFL